MTTPPPSWEDVAWMREQWAQLGGGPFMLKGVCRVDDARRAVDAGVTAISVSNHGGNNLDGTPAAIRMVKPVSDAVGDQIEVLLDGGVRRGSDVVKARRTRRACGDDRSRLPLGAGRQRSGGGGERLDILRSGVDSALFGLGLSSIHELRPDQLIVPDDFHRTLGVTAAAPG